MNKTKTGTASVGDAGERALDVLEVLDDEAMFHAVFPPK